VAHHGRGLLTLLALAWLASLGSAWLLWGPGSPAGETGAAVALMAGLVGLLAGWRVFRSRTGLRRILALVACLAGGASTAAVSAATVYLVARAFLHAEPALKL